MRTFLSSLGVSGLLWLVLCGEIGWKFIGDLMKGGVVKGIASIGWILMFGYGFMATMGFWNINGSMMLTARCCLCCSGFLYIL